MPAKNKTKEEKDTERKTKLVLKDALKKRIDSMYAKHPMLVHYKALNGRIRRLLKRDTPHFATRMTSSALSLCTIYSVDLIVVILRELEKTNLAAEGKHKKKITRSIMRYVFAHSPTLKSLGVSCYPTISTQPIPYLKSGTKKNTQTKEVVSKKTNKTKQN